MKLILLLLLLHFIKAIDTTVKTDQKSVSFIFSRNKSKIENEKLVRRKLELSEFKYDIQYRCGEDNVSAHALSRIHVAATTSSPLGDLVDVHNSLAHPGVTRLLEYIQRHNLPFSLAEVREVVATCRTCLEYKPRFSKPSQAGHIVKASKPFERLGVDIVGPEVPSAKSQSRFVLTVLDEYSRFPFAFTLRNITSQGLFACFSQLFAIFGSPVFIHSDRGSQFISAEFEEFCQSRSISHSRTTPYNPKGNGQTERFNGVHWKGVTCLLHYRRLSTGMWNSVLLEARKKAGLRNFVRNKDDPLILATHTLPEFAKKMVDWTLFLQQHWLLGTIVSRLHLKIPRHTK